MAVLSSCCRRCKFPNSVIQSAARARAASRPEGSAMRILREAVRAAGCSRKQPSIHPNPLRHPGQGEGSPGEAGPRLRLVAGWLCRRTVRMAAPAHPPRHSDPEQRRRGRILREAHRRHLPHGWCATFATTPSPTPRPLHLMGLRVLPWPPGILLIQMVRQASPRPHLYDTHHQRNIPACQTLSLRVTAWP